ncbi:ABC transporter ATP-binding protein [Microbacterium sp. EST19A]|uniref:ABC transporter ATP-binding protein n=1 Tax=Microbacterium sp. EST19A TaxID=2862681 RepID=UPI001CBDDE0D|nr:ABC transporter ATP-binding protein [Microbacterium sp. EST19A]
MTTMIQPEVVAEMRDLSLSFERDGERIPLTFGTDLTLYRGETLCLVGESGSGKSITVRTIAGLLPAGVLATGSVRVGGRELIGSPEREVAGIRGKNVALLLQDPFTILNPLQTIRTHLVESLPPERRRRRDLDDTVRRMLAEVQITDDSVLGRYPFQLSGGMRQRIALAAAMAQDPEILIADEPTTALDATTQRAILDLIRRIQRERGMSVILVTHDLQLGFTYSDRVMVMYAGNILEKASGDALRAGSAHPYTEGLLRSIPSSRERLTVLESIPGSIVPARDTVGHCAFSNRCRWVSPECLAASPPLREIDADHESACIRIEEIRDEVLSDERIGEELAVQTNPALVVADSSTVPALVIESLSKTFGTRRRPGQRAVIDASLVVERGQSVGIIGESGSGKTTLARCVLGLETPSSGRIIVGGKDATSYTDMSRADRHAVRRAVQCVFQDPYTSLNPAHSVGSALTEALSKSGSSRSLTVAELLELVRLPASYASRRPRALSGGERQRVAIARALAVNPDLIVCDEPVASLDVSVQAQILAVLRSANEELGTSLLFITHDLGVVRQVTENVVVMLRGEIVERGATASVLDDPQHEYTQRLVAATDYDAA